MEDLIKECIGRDVWISKIIGKCRAFKGDLFGPKNFEAFWEKAKKVSLVKLKVTLKRDFESYSTI